MKASRLLLTFLFLLGTLTVNAQTEACDVNGNGKVENDDLSCLTNKILGLRNPGEGVPRPCLACPDEHHPHLIDLGLPSGTKWACCNVGAEKPENPGGYYAWGETEVKNDYSISSYLHCDGTEDSYFDLGADIGATEFDVAHVKWGSFWRMPTLENWKEIIENSSWTTATQNEVIGLRITSRINGSSIFLPFTGCRWDTDIAYTENVYGWLSEQSLLGIEYANFLMYGIGNGTDFFRYAGLPVRPVAVSNLPEPVNYTYDVNSDGSVDMADVTCIISRLIAVRQEDLGECFVTLPEEARISADELTILNDGSEIDVDEEGSLGIGLGDVVVLNDDKVVYMSYGEETESRIVNGEETAIALLLNVVPYAVTDLEGDALWLIKQMIGHLSQTRDLAHAIEQSVKAKGYLDMEAVDVEYQAAVTCLRSRLGLDDVSASRSSRWRERQTAYPMFAYGCGETEADGFTLIKESSEWRKAEIEENGYCWKCNFTLLNAEHWCYTGVTKARKNEWGNFDRIDTTVDGTFRYLVKPMNVSAFMDFGTLSDLATDPKDFLKHLSDPDFDRVVNQFWEPLKNLGHILKGEETETATFNKVEVSDIKFDMFPNNEHIGIIGPAIDENLMLFNILKIGFQPVMKLMIKEVKNTDEYKKSNLADKLIVEFVKWIAEADLEFRQDILAAFTNSELPWTKRIETIGKKTFKKFEKFMLEDVALSYVSEIVYESFFDMVKKGYDDPQVKAIFTVYNSILTVGDILLFMLDANYNGVPFELDYGPSINDIKSRKETFTVNGVTFNMMHLTGTPFMMGAADDDKNANSYEKPAHPVTLSDFAIGETEVTQALWEAVMGSNPSHFKGVNSPVENVSWNDCQEFITKLNTITGRIFRLPTEAEWEYAAAGGLYRKGFLYAGTNDIDKVAWHKGNSEKQTHAVKQKEPNEFGLYDMTGNVWEWCQDYYDGHYYDKYEYSKTPVVDPCNDTPGFFPNRVYRGGSWHDDGKYCRVLYRSNNGPGIKHQSLGLRLALTGRDMILDPPPEVVDLALPSGTKWANMNVGATSPEGYGGYYAWGETSEKEVYNTRIFAYTDISGTENDVAHVRWGDNWRMPTIDEINELLNYCKMEWETTQNGVNGFRFTSTRNGKSIFLPAAGYRSGSDLNNFGHLCCYWSSSPHANNWNIAYGLKFSEDATDFSQSHQKIHIVSLGDWWCEYRKEGLSVRPVWVEKSVTPTETPGETVDLGLPSGKLWANKNVGATAPEDYGGYYAWGEIENRTTGWWDDYNWSYYTKQWYPNGYELACIKYNTDSSFGTVDNKTELEPEDDVAHTNWGGHWRMPTDYEFKELLDNCISEWTTQNGINGCRFTSKKNGNSIFLPAASYYSKWPSDHQIGLSGNYWSSTHSNDGNEYGRLTAYSLVCTEETVNLYDASYRCNAFSVRPIWKPYNDLFISTSGLIMLGLNVNYQFEIISGNGNYTATSSNSDVVSVDIRDGNKVIVHANGVGSSTITVTDTESEQAVSVTFMVKQSGYSSEAAGNAIDLGLPSGTKWASCNVGATSPEEYGGYYAWGETEEKDYYSNDTYAYYQNRSYLSIGTDIAGTEYDVAHVKWGGDWRMPTLDEVKELLDNTTTEWITLNGVNGRKLTSKSNGNFIFLPAAGYRCSGSSYNNLYHAGNSGSYWSSSLSPSHDDGASLLYFSSDCAKWSDYSYRTYGRSVRPVFRK